MSTTTVNLYIVVADDDLEDHELVKEALRQCELNHIVTSVFNGEQLLSLLRKEDFYANESPTLPDLIILDVNMPIMNGIEALKAIRQDEKFKSIPVYILTGNTDPVNLERIKELGATGYFEKPLDFNELVKMARLMCHAHSWTK